MLECWNDGKMERWNDGMVLSEAACPPANGR